MNKQNEVTDIDDDKIVLYDTDKALKVETKQPEIETFELVHYSHESISKVLPEFDFDNAPINPADFASSLVETCKKYNGIGLSANQCGFEHRVFVAGANDNYVAYFNPKIIAVSQEMVHMPEACLSFPMLSLYITRPQSVEIEYQDFEGKKHTTKFTGMTARILQHELDHMNGIVYTSRVKPLALKQGLKKVDKQQQKFARQMKRFMTLNKATKKVPAKTKSLNTAQQLLASFTSNETSKEINS